MYFNGIPAIVSVNDSHKNAVHAALKDIKTSHLTEATRLLVTLFCLLPANALFTHEMCFRSLV